MPFAWSRVQFVGDPVALFLGQTFHAGAPGQVLSEQAIELFVAATLPGMIGRGEVALGRKDALQDLVAAKLGAFIEDTGIGVRATIALLHQLGTTQPCATVGSRFIEPPDT